MDLVIILSIVALLLVLCIYISSRFKKSAPKVEEKKARQPVARDENVPRVRRRNRMVNRNVVNEEEEEEDNGEIFDSIAQPEGKIGAKKLRKLEEKAEKKARREAELEEREERKLENEKQELKLKKQRELEEANELKLEQEAEEKRLEKERQEHEAYLIMKQQFSVEETGVTEVFDDSSSLLTEFINYIKESKVVILEDLAANFKIKTQDVIDRISGLIEEDRLSGVIDDRGKFIYITPAEYVQVADFINKRGRVTITELAEASNTLVNMDSENKTGKTVEITEA